MRKRGVMAVLAEGWKVLKERNVDPTGDEGLGSLSTRDEALGRRVVGR